MPDDLMPGIKGVKRSGRDDFDGSLMQYEELQGAINKLARFETLVQLPEKRDPCWPKWSAAATKGFFRVMGKGDTDIEALQNLLDELKD